MDFDNDRINATVLTLLWLNREFSGMAWKGFNWASTERLPTASQPGSRSSVIR